MDREQVEIGDVGSLLRGGFTSLPYYTLSAAVDNEQLAMAFAERIALTLSLWARHAVSSLDSPHVLGLET